MAQRDAHTIAAEKAAASLKVQVFIKQGDKYVLYDEEPKEPWANELRRTWAACRKNTFENADGPFRPYEWVPMPNRFPPVISGVEQNHVVVSISDPAWDRKHALVFRENPDVVPTMPLKLTILESYHDVTAKDITQQFRPRNPIRYMKCEPPALYPKTRSGPTQPGLPEFGN